MFVSTYKWSSESVHLRVCGCVRMCVWNSYWSQFTVSSGDRMEKHRMKKHSQLLFTSTKWLIRNPELHRDLLTPKAWKWRPTLLRRLGNSSPKASSLSCSFLSCEMKSQDSGVSKHQASDWLSKLESWLQWPVPSWGQLLNSLEGWRADWWTISDATSQGALDTYKIRFVFAYCKTHILLP